MASLNNRIYGMHPKNFKITVVNTFLLYLILDPSDITSSHLLLLQMIGLVAFLHPRCFCLALILL